MIKRINMSISYLCNLNCTYCFLSQESRLENTEFTRFDDLYNFLLTVNLDKLVKVNLASGELTLKPSLVRKVCRVFRKVERVRDVVFQFGMYSNGTNPDVLISLLRDGTFTPGLTSVSWDGIASEVTRNNYNHSYTIDDGMININKIYGSGYANDIVVRTAITKDLLYLNSLERAVPLVQFLEFYTKVINWEYYFLLDDDDYRNPNLIPYFKNFIDQCIGLYRASNYRLKIYNMRKLDETYSNTLPDIAREKKLWCHSIDGAIDITIDGKVTQCGSFTPNYVYGFKNLDMFDDISQPFNESKIIQIAMDNCINCKKCDFMNCGNKHCHECSRIIPYRWGSDFEYKAKQVCALRTVEREEFLKDMI